MASPAFGLHPTVLVLATFAASSVACARENPAFDLDEFADEADDLIGDGDGDSGDGDGDGDSGDGDGDPGDGDGDPGDGDGDPGDGDGDPGDGDGDPGDGDGDPGDGDGDSGDGDGDGDGDGETGDGDGEPDSDLCPIQLPADLYMPFATESLAEIQTANAPGFAAAPENCHVMMICSATQDFCDPEHEYMAKVYSSGMAYIGQGDPNPQALQIRFHPGGGSCEGAVLDLDLAQAIGLQIWNGGGFELLSVRMPCLEEYNVPIYVATDGSTFWDPEVSIPAAVWD